MDSQSKPVSLLPLPLLLVLWISLICIILQDFTVT